MQPCKIVSSLERRSYRTARSFFRVAAFSVSAAAKQIVPPNTAAGIDANVRRGTLKEIDDPGPKRVNTRASIHNAMIPTKDPTTVQSHRFHRKDFLGIKRYAGTKTTNHGTNRGAPMMQTIRARPEAVTIRRLSDDMTCWPMLFSPIKPIWSRIPKGTICPPKDLRLTVKLDPPMCPHALAFMGLSREELCGWGWRELIHLDDVPQAQAAWDQAVRSGKPYSTDHRIRRIDGLYYWVAARGQPVTTEDGQVQKWVGTFVEIQGQRHATEDPILHVDTVAFQNNLQEDNTGQELAIQTPDMVYLTMI